LPWDLSVVRAVTALWLLGFVVLDMSLLPGRWWAGLRR
jgi:hypothetical protein